MMHYMVKRCTFSGSVICAKRYMIHLNLLMTMFRDGGDLGLRASEKIKVQYCSIDVDLKHVNY